jgi:glycosyltransferase involved in cell wall biosynthesis
MTACITYNKGNPDQIRRQMEAYLQEGYPRQNGLATCTVILRRHHAGVVVQAMEAWWEEINRYSVRDQLSFDYTVHRKHLKYAVIPGHVYRNHFFRFTEHRQPDAGAPRVGWILNGSPETASARIMGDNVHEYLTGRGVPSKILFRPEARMVYGLNLARTEIDALLNHNINLLVIVKLDRGPNLNYLLARCKKGGIRVVYGLCDLPSRGMLAKSDAIIATSDEFRKLIPRRHRTKLHIVFDGYEHDHSRHKQHHDQRRLKLCLISNQVWDKVPCIPELPEGVSLKIIGPGPQILATSFRRSRVFRDSKFAFEYVGWDAATVLDEALECDAGILPWPRIGKAERVKSSNRLLLFQSLGLPVIASPVPAYVSQVRQGENGFIANTTHEWLDLIRLLRDNPDKRRSIGEAGRLDVVDHYSKAKQGELYLSVFRKILAMPVP